MPKIDEGRPPELELSLATASVSRAIDTPSKIEKRGHRCWTVEIVIHRRMELI